MKGRHETRALGLAWPALLAQAQTNPPTDAPWCFFDLAELELYQRKSKAFQLQLAAGISACNAKWQVETCRDALKGTLQDNGIKLPGLIAGLKMLDAAITDWDQHGGES